MALEPGNAGLGLPDRFVGAVLDRATEGFDANQYSFFGDGPAGGAVLDGALEDALDAPLEDDEHVNYGDGIGGEGDEGLWDIDHEDLSLATMLRNQARLREQGKTAEDLAEERSLDELISTSIGQRSLLQDDDADALLAAASSPHVTLSGYGRDVLPMGLTIPSSSSLLGPSQPGSLTGLSGNHQQLPTPLASAAPSHLGVQPPAPNPLLQMLKKGAEVKVAGALTAEQLEAQMLAKASAVEQQQQQQFMMRQLGPMGQPMAPPNSMMHPQAPMHGSSFFSGPIGPMQPPGPQMMHPGMDGMMHPMGMPGPQYGMRPPMPMGPQQMPHPQGFPGHMGQPHFQHMQHMPRGPGMMAPPPPPPHMMGVRPPPPPGGFMPHGGHGMPMQPHMGPRPMGQPAPMMSFSAAVRGRGAGDQGGDQRQGPMRAPQYSVQAAPHGAENQRSHGRCAGGKLMSGEELEHIMHIMHCAVNSGVPYKEDHYYMAYVNKHQAGKNAAAFEPHALRDLSEEVAKLDPSAQVKFVAVEGLGKIVLSNIRTPKVLMDLSNTGPVAARDGSTAMDTDGPKGASSAPPSKRLEQEPLLAARIMVEDCMSLLLDVDDIDRCFSAASARGRQHADAEALQQRRALLAAGIVSSFRLPAAPEGVTAAADAAAGGNAPANDGVFLRIMALPKGRKLLARTLLLLLPSQAGGAPAALAAADSAAAAPHGGVGSVQHLLWALLRNARAVFHSSLGAVGGAADGGVALRALVAGTSAAADAARRVISSFGRVDQVAGALTALAAGITAHAAAADPAAAPQLLDSLLPLANMHGPGALTGADGALTDAVQQPEAWLGEILAALVARGQQLGLGRGDASAGEPATEQQWAAALSVLLPAVTSHLEALSTMGAMAAASGNADLIALVRRLACEPLLTALQGAAGVGISEAQRARLQELAQPLLSAA